MFMPLRALATAFLIGYISTQDSCDFYQYVEAGTTYYIYNPNFPNKYASSLQCRWLAECPPDYLCRLNCPVIDLPESPSCNADRLLVSRTGDPRLNQSEAYCGRRSLTVDSVGQRISIGLIAPTNTIGGSLICEVTAQNASVLHGN